MIAKVLMRPCYVESFHEEENSQVKNCTIFIANVKMIMNILFMPASMTLLLLKYYMECNQVAAIILVEYIYK